MDGRELAGGAGGWCVREGAVWRAKPKTEPCGLGFGWTCRGGVMEGQGGWCGARDGRVSWLGGLEAGVCEEGVVWHAKPKTEPCGLDFG